MAKNLFIFGCSGVAKSIIDSINRSPNYDFDEIIFIDVKSTEIGETFYGFKVLHMNSLKNTDTHGHFAIFAFFN